MSDPTLITPSDLARRWQVSGETIRKYDRQGLIRPVLGEGHAVRYALAEIQAIERGRSCADVALLPLTFEGRTSPRSLFHRVEVAREAVELAVRLDTDKAADLEVVGTAARAVLTLIAGGTASVPGQPVVGASGSYGVNLPDPDAARDLARLAHAALAPLSLAECRATLADLGHKMRERFTSELRRILKAGSGKA